MASFRISSDVDVGSGWVIGHVWVDRGQWILKSTIICGWEAVTAENWASVFEDVGPGDGSEPVLLISLLGVG